MRALLAALLLLICIGCKETTITHGPIVYEDDTIEVHRGDCATVDIERLLVAREKTYKHDFPGCFRGKNKKVKVTMSALLDAAGANDGGSHITLKCGQEYVLRHELDHLLAVLCSDCDGNEWTRVSRLPDQPGHDLDLACDPWP